MPSEKRGEINEAESWRVRLREEQENLLPNLGRLPVHGHALYCAWAQGESIKPFIISSLFSIWYG